MNKHNKKMFNFPNLKVLSMYLLLILLISQTLAAQSNQMDNEQNGNLISYTWLEKNLNNPGVILLDASFAHVFKEKHIEGAIGVNSSQWFGVNEISNIEMEKIFQDWGISSDKKIVIYDEGGAIMAARLFYALYYYGFPVENLFILDGGLSKWQEAGLPVTTEVKELSDNGTFKIRGVNEEIRARISETLTASGDTENNILIEALEPGWHYGQVQMFSRAGHIPYSVLMPGAEFYNADKTFKTTEDIEKMLNYFNVDMGKQIYTYCGGGIAASVPFFVLKFIMKYPKVKLFIESELGWLQDERELPFWTYDTPYLLRKSNWLKTWSGKMLRMYFVPKISIVDIRTEEEFRQGHIQYSVNIPGGTFKGALKEPGKLRNILEVSGVKTDNEVVIVSGKGLTKESALLFTIIKNMGYEKGSIFIDGIDKLNQHGVALIKDTLSTIKQMAEKDPTATLNNYENIVQDNIFIHNINDQTNLHPRVFIASGETVPHNIGNNKVIHLPYHNFIGEDGKPKEAKDIWALIDKAGVPRYTELICFAKDPDEAAANYFILKLMGYPHVKIWIN